jgi:O-antigen ligase
MAARFERLSTPEKISIEAPIRQWRNALKVFSTFPLFGAGFGAYGAASRIVIPGEETSLAHSDYLQALAELGAAGITIALALAVTIVRLACQAARRLKHSNTRFLAIACVGGLAAGLLNSSLESNLYVPANAILLCWIGGITVGLTEKHLIIQPSYA